MIIKKDEIDKIPSQIGIYLFLQKNKPIYIGKAVNLKARIASHLKNSLLNPKEALIIKSFDRIKTIITDSEFNAFLLEAFYIKKYKPKYNVVWKDDKTHLYIKITVSEEFPKIYSVRQENDNKSVYFGPFNSERRARQLTRIIRKIIPFCAQKEITKHSCFYSKINLCNPCPNYINSLKNFLQKQSLKRKYCQNIKRIKLIFNQKSNIVLHSLKCEMNEHIKKENFEKAMEKRNKINLLENLISGRSFEEIDILSLKNSNLYLSKEIDDFLKRYFSKIADDKSELRIECYDISNLFGKEAASSMVVFKNGSPEKKEYRRFKIKTVRRISDIEMLEETLRRRFNKKNWPKPQFLIIDGGKPQIRKASRVLKEFNLNIPLVGLAKNPDRLILGNGSFETIKLAENSPLFNLLKRIRDESHRFAKNYHLFLRKKKMMI